MCNKKKSLKKLLITFLFAALIITDTIMWAAHIGTLTPYAITSGDKEICRVRNREAAARVLNDVFNDMTREDTNISAISSGYSIEKGGSGTIISEEEAKEAVLESASNNDASITIASSKTAMQSFTPDPDYKKNGEMFAGDAEVISKGSNGEKQVGVTYTTVNGKTEDKEQTDIEILDEGVPAVIEKGTLGLPKGETWQEYDGDPVANNGDDIITSAMQHLGLRYVWGGKNLETGVDCSGFVIALYRQYGMSITYPLENEGYEVPYSEAQPGDLLCFPGHFGLYIGDGQMIHASSSAHCVTIGSVWGRNLRQVRRLVDVNQ